MTTQLKQNIAKLIDKGHFVCDPSLRELHVPEGVTHLPEKSFENCLNLKKIVLPQSLLSIGENAFAGCINLQKINFPNNLSTIGDQAFIECGRLLSVDLFNTKIEKLHFESFADCKALKHVRLPEKLKAIDISAFARCNNLVFIDLPKYVAHIQSQQKELYNKCKTLREIPALRDVLNKNNEEILWFDIQEMTDIKPEKTKTEIEIPYNDLRTFIGYAQNYLNDAKNDLTNAIDKQPSEAMRHICETRLKEIETELGKCEAFLCQ